MKDAACVRRETQESPTHVAQRYNAAQPFSKLSEEEQENILSMFDWQVRILNYWTNESFITSA